MMQLLALLATLVKGLDIVARIPLMYTSFMTTAAVVLIHNRVLLAHFMAFKTDRLPGHHIIL